MIFENVIQRVIDAHRSSNGVIRNSSRHTTARSLIHFIDSTHVQSFTSIWLYFLYQITITIIDELCGLPGGADGDRNQAVFRIEGLIVRHYRWEIFLDNIREV